MSNAGPAESHESQRVRSGKHKWWVVRELRFIQPGQAISVFAPNVEVQHNILDGYMAEGIRVEGVSGAFIHHNVVAYTSTSSWPNRLP
jgi:hypothetical protein